LGDRGQVTVALAADGVEANPVTIEVLRHQYLNLDFETTARGQLWGWSLYGAGYQFLADSSVAYAGQQSLRIRNLTAVAPAYAQAYRAFPLGAVRGRNVRFSGFIETEGIARGSAGLGCIVNGASGNIFFDFPVGPSGATSWQQYSANCAVGPDATVVIVMVAQNGDGTAWFDNLTVDIDGLPYQPAPAPSIGEPPAAQLDWVRHKPQSRFPPRWRGRASTSYVP
jgi:hypothetical protein